MTKETRGNTARFFYTSPPLKPSDSSSHVSVRCTATRLWYDLRPARCCAHFTANEANGPACLNRDIKLVGKLRRSTSSSNLA